MNESNPLPPEARSKLSAIRDPATRQYLVDLWNGLMSEGEVEAMRESDRRDREAEQHELDKRLLNKARAGEYGAEAQAVAQSVSAHPTPHALRQAREYITKATRDERR